MFWKSLIYKIFVLTFLLASMLGIYTLFQLLCVRKDYPEPVITDYFPTTTTAIVRVDFEEVIQRTISDLLLKDQNDVLIQKGTRRFSDRKNLGIDLTSSAYLFRFTHQGTVVTAALLHLKRPDVFQKNISESLHPEQGFYVKGAYALLILDSEDKHFDRSYWNELARTLLLSPSGFNFHRTAFHSNAIDGTLCQLWVRHVPGTVAISDLSLCFTLQENTLQIAGNGHCSSTMFLNRGPRFVSGAPADSFAELTSYVIPEGFNSFTIPVKGMDDVTLEGMDGIHLRYYSGSIEPSPTLHFYPDFQSIINFKDAASKNAFFEQLIPFGSKEDSTLYLWNEHPFRAEAISGNSIYLGTGKRPEMAVFNDGIIFDCDIDPALIRKLNGTGFTRKIIELTPGYRLVRQLDDNVKRIQLVVALEEKEALLSVDGAIVFEDHQSGIFSILELFLSQLRD